MRILALLLAFGILCYWCISRHSPRIEHDVLTQVRSTLVANDYLDIVPTIDGRDVLLTGQVDTEEERQNLLRAVRDNEGVRSLDHTLALTPVVFPVEDSSTTVINVTIPETPVVAEEIIETQPPEEPVVIETVEPEPIAIPEDSGLPLSDLEINMAWKDDALNLSGYLPDQASKDILLSKIDNSLTINDSIELTDLAGEWPQNWSSITSTMLSHLLSLKHGDTRIEPGNVHISGLTKDNISRDLLNKLLRESLPSNWVLHFDIDIPLSEASVACETEIQNLLNAETINFKLSSAKINQASIDLMNSIIDNVQTCSAATFLIEGHTDALGGEEFNQQLSERRARSVKDYLVSKGVAEHRIEIKGYGETRPIADNSTITGRSQNRRIEFVVLGESL